MFGLSPGDVYTISSGKLITIFQTKLKHVHCAGMLENQQPIKVFSDGEMFFNTNFFIILIKMHVADAFHI